MVATDRIVSVAEALGITPENVYFLGPRLAQMLHNQILEYVRIPPADIPTHFETAVSNLATEAHRIRLCVDDTRYDWKANAEKDIRQLSTAMYVAADWYVHLTRMNKSPEKLLLDLKRKLC